MRGIATMHNGIRYRSLLEAKWAAFFTNIGWQFEYEPFEGNGYIPDFLILGEASFLVEVKPAHNWRGLEEHTSKVERGLAGIWGGYAIIVGASPIILHKEGDYACGLLTESCELRSWEAGIWSLCPDCRHAAIVSQYGSFQRRPCAHYDGSQWPIEDWSYRLLNARWKDASNQVQWRGSGK